MSPCMIYGLAQVFRSAFVNHESDARADRRQIGVQGSDAHVGLRVEYLGESASLVVLQASVDNQWVRCAEYGYLN